LGAQKKRERLYYAHRKDGTEPLVGTRTYFFRYKRNISYRCAENRERLFYEYRKEEPEVTEPSTDRKKRENLFHADIDM
jgi:hypothetical protein